MSNIGLETLVDIYRITDSITDVQVKSKLKWFIHNLYFNDATILKSIISLVENGIAVRHHYRIISDIELPSAAVIDVLFNTIKSDHKELKKAVLKVFFRLANSGHPSFVLKFKEWFPSIDDEMISLAESFNLGNSTFQLIYDSLIAAGQVEAEDELFGAAERYYWMVGKIDFRTGWKAGPLTLLADFATAGATFYYQTSSVLSNAIKLANLLRESPALLSILAQWTFYTMDELVAGNDEYYNVSGDLAVLLSICVQNSPDFLSELGNLPDIEYLLINIVNSCNSWVCRRGAIVLLSYMPEISISSLLAIIKSLKDVSFVRDGIVQCWKYFKVGLDQKIIDKLIENISSDSGVIASTSIRLLSETCKSIQGDDVLRKQIVIALANELRAHKEEVFRTTNVYVSDTDGNLRGLNFEGSLEDILYSELIKISGLS